MPLINAVVKMRSTKTQEEIEELERAAVIGYRMHTTAMRLTKPGVTEKFVGGQVDGIANSYGSKVSFPTIFTQHGEIMHGKMGTITHGGRGIFAGLHSPFAATRYHSLIVERETLPAALEVTAALADGTIMGLAHRSLPIHGVQFHPESIASEHGRLLLGNFLDLARVPA